MCYCNYRAKNANETIIKSTFLFKILQTTTKFINYSQQINPKWIPKNLLFISVQRSQFDPRIFRIIIWSINYEVTHKKKWLRLNSIYWQNGNKAQNDDWRYNIFHLCFVLYTNLLFHNSHLVFVIVRSVVCKLVVVNKYCFVLFFFHSFNEHTYHRQSTRFYERLSHVRSKLKRTSFNTRHMGITHSHAFIHLPLTRLGLSPQVSTNRYALHITYTNALAKWRK